jgi:hypothetical protein
LESLASLTILSVYLIFSTIMFTFQPHITHVLHFKQFFCYNTNNELNSFINIKRNITKTERQNRILPSGDSYANFASKWILHAKLIFNFSKMTNFIIPWVPRRFHWSYGEFNLVKLQILALHTCPQQCNTEVLSLRRSSATRGVLNPIK